MPFRTRLDLDVRGNVMQTHSGLVIEVGEIKSNCNHKLIEDAYNQLQIIACFVTQTLRLLRLKQPNLPSVQFIGRVFVPKPPKSDFAVFDESLLKGISDKISKNLADPKFTVSLCVEYI